MSNMKTVRIGHGVNAYGPANLPIKDKEISVSFISPIDFTLQSCTAWFKCDDTGGYSSNAANAIINVSLQDSTNMKLHNGIVDKFIGNPENTDNTIRNFPMRQDIKAGELYHILMNNLSPSMGWVSLNCLRSLDSITRAYFGSMPKFAVSVDGIEYQQMVPCMALCGVDSEGGQVVLGAPYQDAYSLRQTVQGQKAYQQYGYTIHDGFTLEFFTPPSPTGKVALDSLLIPLVCELPGSLTLEVFSFDNLDMSIVTTSTQRIEASPTEVYKSTHDLAPVSSVYWLDVSQVLLANTKYVAKLSSSDGEFCTIRLDAMKNVPGIVRGTKYTSAVFKYLIEENVMPEETPTTSTPVNTVEQLKAKLVEIESERNRIITEIIAEYNRDLNTLLKQSWIDTLQAEIDKLKK